MNEVPGAEDPKMAPGVPPRKMLLTVASAAQQAKVGEETIRKWWDSGEITGRRTVGGHRLIDPDSLERRLACVGILEASKIAGCSEQTMRIWFDRGLVTGYRTGTGQRRISMASLQARLAEDIE